MLYRVVVLAALLVRASAFAAPAPVSRPVSRSRSAIRMQQDDPIGNPFIKAINALQEAVQNSPAAQFKSKLAKMQAGEYDEVATRAKLEQLMSEPAVMFSFTT